MTEQDIEIMKTHMEWSEKATEGQVKHDPWLHHTRTAKLYMQLDRWKLRRNVKDFRIGWSRLVWPTGHELEGQGNVLLKGLRGEQTQRPETKADYRRRHISSAVSALSVAGIKYSVHNHKYHFVVQGVKGKIDYWPTTNKVSAHWWDNRKGVWGNIDKVIKLAKEK